MYIPYVCLKTEPIKHSEICKCHTSPVLWLLKAIIVECSIGKPTLI